MKKQALRDILSEVDRWDFLVVHLKEGSLWRMSDLQPQSLEELHNATPLYPYAIVSSRRDIPCSFHHQALKTPLDESRFYFHFSQPYKIGGYLAEPINRNSRADRVHMIAHPSLEGNYRRMPIIHFNAILDIEIIRNQESH